MQEIVATILLVAIAVVFAAVVTLVLLQTPPPAASPAAALEAHVLRAAPDTLVVEHRGGREVALRSLVAVVRVDAAEVRSNVGDRLAAGDPAWVVTGPSGAPRGPDASFGPGDQLRYRDARIPAAGVSLTVVDDARGLVLLSAGVRPRDEGPPVLAGARTRTPTTIEAWFSEPLHNVSASDLWTSAGTLVSAVLLGNGSRVELTTSAPFPPNATPVVGSRPAPAGTADLAWKPLVGSTNVTASDGVPPAITSGPTVGASTTTATLHWTTNEAATSSLEYGPTPNLGRVATSSALVTAHAVAVGPLTPSTLYYFRVTSMDAAGNAAVTNATGTTFTTDHPGWPSFAEPVANVIYPSVEVRDLPVRLGFNVLNPTGTTLHVDLVRFRAAPPLGSGADDAFFRAPLVHGLGSDLNASLCAWTGVNTNTITCDPPGTVAVPPGGMLQVVVEFTSSKAGAATHVKLTGEAEAAAPAGTLRSEINVLHANTIMLDLLARSGPSPTGQRTAGHRPGTGGVPLDFHYQWSVIKGDAKTRTRFMVPPGWTNLTVPLQPALDVMTVYVRPPTPTSAGYVDVSQDIASGSRELYFRATPPPGPGLFVFQVDFEGSKEGSSGVGSTFQNLYWFGVQLT